MHLEIKREIMRIITQTTINEFVKIHPESKAAFGMWCQRTSKAHWTCFADIKKDFNSVDSVGNQHYVFNIKGNDFRLVVVVKFTPETIYVRFVGTHEEYSKIKDIRNM